MEKVRTSGFAHYANKLAVSSEPGLTNAQLMLTNHDLKPGMSCFNHQRVFYSSNTAWQSNLSAGSGVHGILWASGSPIASTLWVQVTHPLKSSTDREENTWMISSSMIIGGLSWWQSWLCVWIGYFISGTLICMSGRIGATYHISFPVVIRASFGIWGSLWPVFNRAAMACIWYGVQSWIGGTYSASGLSPNLRF